MKIFGKTVWETKIREYPIRSGRYGMGYVYKTTVDVKVWKLFGIVVWRKCLD